jgi:hypothetical protein
MVGVLRRFLGNGSDSDWKEQNRERLKRAEDYKNDGNYLLAAICYRDASDYKTASEYFATASCGYKSIDFYDMAIYCAKKAKMNGRVKQLEEDARDLRIRRDHPRAVLSQ